MNIRPTTESDHSVILDIHRNAFGPDEGDEIVGLLEQMFVDATAMPLLSLLAEKDARPAGHILFSAVGIEQEQVTARILAPLAVSPDFQGAGVGSALIDAGLNRLRESGVALVFVLGDPAYYSRFGFEPATRRGLQAPHPIPKEYEDAWMVQALEEGVLDHVEGTVRCSEVLGQQRYWL